MIITVLQHVPFEKPAAAASWAERNGIGLETVRLYAGDTLPDLRTVEGALILGGPMGVGDIREHPWIEAELAFIGDCLEHNRPLLGICLGAQLIAAAAGAQVAPMGFREIGWWEVEGDDGVFPAFHWHGDQFELPKDAVRLYHSAACPEQGFRIGDRAVGLQFHLEMDRMAVTRMLAEGADEIARFQSTPWVQSADEISAFTEQGIAATTPRLNRLLDYLFGTPQANSST